MKRATRSSSPDVAAGRLWRFSIPKLRNHYAVPNIFRADRVPTRATGVCESSDDNGDKRETQIDCAAMTAQSEDTSATLYLDMKQVSRPVDEYCDLHIERINGATEGNTDRLILLQPGIISSVDGNRLKGNLARTAADDHTAHGSRTRKGTDAFPEIVFSFFSTKDRKNVCRRRLSDNNALYENDNSAKDYFYKNSNFGPKKVPKTELHYASSPMLMNDDNKNCLNKNDIHKSEIKIFVSNTKTDDLPLIREINYDSPKSLLYNDTYDEKNNFYNEVLYSAESTNSDETLKLNYTTPTSDSTNYAESANQSCDPSVLKRDANFNNRDRNLSVCNNSIDSITVLDYVIEKPMSEYEEFNYAPQTTISQVNPRCRRATLLRNEIIPFYTVQKRLRSKKVRLTRAWRDIKGWIGTEKVKINRIIKKHAAKQRLHSFDDNTCFSSECSQLDDTSTNRGSDEHMNLSYSRSESGLSGRIEFSPEIEDDVLRENYTKSDNIDSVTTSSSDLQHVDKPSLQISEPILLKINCEDINIWKEKTASNSSLVCDTFDGHINRKFSVVSDVDHKSVSDYSSIENTFMKNGIFFLAPNYVFGQNGFEELRRYVKQGGDFCKELSTILQERSDAELQYAKSLSKLGSKLSKICRVNVGSCSEAWRHISQEMEQQAEIHRQYSNNLAESIIKPLKQMTDSQHKLRKQVETNVDKTSRCLTEWRTAEAKSKKQSHAAARENEKLQDPMAEARMIRSPSLVHITHTHVVNNIRPDRHSTVTPPSPSNGHTDKEMTKIQLKKRKAEDAVKKADEEYYTLCVRAERSRLDWESTILRGASIMEQLEEERLHSLKSTAEGYLKLSSSVAPQIAECIQRLAGPVAKADPISDIKAVRGVRGAPQAGTCEQLLPDFYCEHITLAMNRERRKLALTKILQLIKNDIEKERKSKQGLEKLSKAIKENPNFGTDDSQHNVTEKMYHMRSMLTYLEAARYKITTALCELENKPKGQHPLAAHIQVTRDKQGLQQSLLKIPSWLQSDYQTEKPSSPLSFTSTNDIHSKRQSVTSDRVSLRKQSNLSTPPLPPESPLDWTDRGDGDGVSNQPDSDFDEFSSQDGSCGDITDATNTVITPPSVPVPNEPTTTPVLNRKSIGKCKALYNYTPNLYDELKLSPGDLINIFEKQEDGWWCGDLNGTIGIFPATYVEEIV